jgi:hypothetical protein
MKKNQLIKQNSFTEFLLYTTPNGKVKVEILLRGENIWLTQAKIAELFGVDRSVVTKHLQNIYIDRELVKEATCAKIAHVRNEGNRQVSREVEFYNLDAILSVGYRVNSSQATQFRIWATERLKEYIIKGFTMDDERLKTPNYTFGTDYFRELLERVRSIRASERRIYQQITDIFAECSIDYDRESSVSHEFYAMVQSKFHFAITGKTAPEIIYGAADATSPHMGLSTWRHSPDGRILQSDVTIAKNYLKEDEIKRLERTMTGFFDYIEGLIDRNNSFTMKEFAESVDKFLTFNEYKILDGKGRISKVDADAKAISEYKEFNKYQKIESDFDREVIKYLKEMGSGDSEDGDQK